MGEGVGGGDQPRGHRRPTAADLTAARRDQRTLIQLVAAGNTDLVAQI